MQPDILSASGLAVCFRDGNYVQFNGIGEGWEYTSFKCSCTRCRGFTKNWPVCDYTEVAEAWARGQGRVTRMDIPKMPKVCPDEPNTPAEPPAPIDRFQRYEMPPPQTPTDECPF